MAPRTPRPVVLWTACAGLALAAVAALTVATAAMPTPPAATVGDAPARPARPNVVAIVVDDLRPMFAAYGNKYVQTPNLDKLAARSLLFRCVWYSAVNITIAACGILVHRMLTRDACPMQSLHDHAATDARHNTRNAPDAAGTRTRTSQCVVRPGTKHSRAWSGLQASTCPTSGPHPARWHYCSSLTDTLAIGIARWPSHTRAVP